MTVQELVSVLDYSFPFIVQEYDVWVPGSLRELYLGFGYGLDVDICNRDVQYVSFDRDNLVYEIDLLPDDNKSRKSQTKGEA